jgi:hypothetical protein
LFQKRADSSTELKDFDNAQLHYFQIVAPNAKMATSWKCYYKGSLHEEHCSKQDEINFLTNALEHFKDTDWINIIKKRMEGLKTEK